MIERLRRTLKGWRTIALALVSGLVGLLDVLDGIDLRPLVEALVPAKGVGAVMVVLAIAFGVLRLVTTGPVGQKESG